jgi:hypothetical protein
LDFVLFWRGRLGKGLDAYFVHQINKINNELNGYDPYGYGGNGIFRRSLQDALTGAWAKLGVAVSVITIVSIIPMSVQVSFTWSRWLTW